MPAALADSAIHRTLFGDPATAALFTDSAEVRAMLLVEGALARVQGQLGVIPETAAAAIDRASREVLVDPAALAEEAAVNGVPVPGLVAAFRKAMQAPEHAQFMHWGATSQDVIDTALALRLRRVTQGWDERLGRLIAALGALARVHADLPMAARTYGQAATPTSFGAVVAGWGWPLLDHRTRLAEVRARLCTVSLGGAAGTLSAMEGHGPAIRAALARALDLTDPGHSWHADRTRMADFAAWMTGLTASLGKMGEDLILMTQSGIGEVRLAGAGGSSTMPQKQNPVGPSVLAALSRHVLALAAAVQGATVHRQQRDGAAWFVEWLTLPQTCISTGRSIGLALEIVEGITPDAEAMARGLAEGQGVILAEGFTFALARQMPRPEAQARIKALCKEAAASGTPLRGLVARDFPDLPGGAAPALGTAPAEALAFAQAAGA